MSCHYASIICNVKNIHSIGSMTIKLPTLPKEESCQIVLNIIYFFLSGKPNKHFVSWKHDLVIFEVVYKTLFFQVKYFDIIRWIITVNLLLNLEHDLLFSNFTADNFEKIRLNFFLSLKNIFQILLNWSFSDLDVIINWN